MASALRVAYLNSQYPALSHTFIESEILALRDRGVEVHTFSIRPCPVEDLKSEAMRAEHQRTSVILDGDLAGLSRAHRQLAVSHPSAYRRGLARAARSGYATPKGKLWSYFYFGEAVLLHQRMRAVGLRHVHVHMSNVSADVARLACHIGNAIDGPGSWTWSLTVHGPADFEMIEQWDLAAKLREASGVSCISDFCRSQLMRLVEPSHWPKMKKVAMATNPDQYLPPSSREHDGPLRLLYVGRLVPQKGGPILVEALAKLAAEGVHMQTRIVGQGELHDTLRSAISQAGLDQEVELVGPVGQDDMVEQYHWADVFVLPSFQEGLPVVLMEAMATELPVVTTQIAAISELVVDGENGRVLPPGRADLLAEALRELQDMGPEARLHLGRNGRVAVLAAHTPKTTGPAMHEFLMGVAAAEG